MKTNTDAFTGDTLTIVPATIKILIPAGASLPVQYNPNTNTFRFSGESLPDSIFISYRTLPVNLAKPQFHRDPAKYDTLAYFGDKDPSARELRERREEFFATKGISKTGSITRGVSFGNAQNVFVNSALNLQLEGQLSDDISLSAVISDQNVPYQPEGNTQQIRDFDRVFVQLKGKQWSISAGDVVFRNPAGLYRGVEPSYFLRYYRNVQGGQVQTQYDAWGKVAARTSAGIAISKGKFASMMLEVNEGVQGPYRLRGPANERFIIVLANSERVYLDGRLLQRGFDSDYIIDYNTAEITFTTQVVITQYSRVRADFEYSERNYSRSILTGSHEQTAGKFRFFTNFYQERDNPRNPLTLQLSENEKLALQETGDNPAGALLPGEMEVESFTSNLILYRKADTLVNGEMQSAYVYSEDPEQARFQLQFTETGAGNYRLLRQSANGRVYEWVSPINGIPQGSFEPVRVVPLPTQRQMLTVGGEYSFNSEERVFAETAFSKMDLNLYSPLDAHDDRGSAFKLGYLNRGKPLRLLPGYEWIGGVDFERDSRFFTPIDRFRGVEFDRDWSIQPSDTLSADDHLVNATIGIRKRIAATNVPASDHPLAAPSAIETANPAPSASFTPGAATDRLVYRLGWREKGEAVNGWQQRVEAAKTIRRLQLTSDAFWLRSVRGESLSEWIRLQATALYHLTYITPGYTFSMDKNRLTSRLKTDSIMGTAVNFEENRFFIRTPDSLHTRLQADYSIRQDYTPLEGQLVKNTLARMANAAWQMRFRNGDIGLRGTYRTSSNLNPSRVLPREETIMGRLDWNNTWLERAIRSELTYVAATGRELRREYVYLLVPTGQGTHTWRDDNDNGRQELNEFYEAINPDEKNYAKFFVPTDVYVPAYTQNVNYRLSLTAPATWRGKGMFRSFLGRLSSVSSWTLNRKITEGDFLKRYMPFGSQIPDSSLLSAQEALRSTLFFNRANPRYGLDLNILRTGQKQLLTGGTEARQQQELRLTGRINLNREYSFRGSVAQLQRRTASDFLAARNFTIAGRQAGPELAYQPKADFRITAAYQYSIKENQATETRESAVSHAVSMETRWAKVSKRTLMANVRWTQIRYGGPVNTPLGYEMLEALQPGTNWNWSLNWQQRLANGLQLNVNYEGRQSGEQRVIHIGRMQVTALF